MTERRREDRHAPSSQLNRVRELKEELKVTPNYDTINGLVFIIIDHYSKLISHAYMKQQTTAIKI